MKNSNKSGQGAREIMARAFSPGNSNPRPVWCHDRNRGQHPALEGG